MILDCKGCGDPVFSHMERCARCGAENPFFTPSEPSHNSRLLSDSGTQFGLLSLGVFGVLAGAAAFASIHAPNPNHNALLPWAAALCPTFGGLSLVFYHRLDVDQLKAPTKLWLRGFLLVLSLAV